MNKKANLNQAFKELRKLGYFARQNFMCCQNCANLDTLLDKTSSAANPAVGPRSQGMSKRWSFTTNRMQIN